VVRSLDPEVLSDPEARRPRFGGRHPRAHGARGV